VSKESVKVALGQAMAGIEKNPNSAKLVFRAETRWEEDVRCSATVREFPPMTVDEPPELGGGDQAPNPVELLLVALGTCQEIMYAAYAAVMDIQFDEVTVDCKGNLDLRGLFPLDETIPPGYTSIKFETNIKSTESPEKIAALIGMVEAHCPVLDTLTRAVTVSGDVLLNGEHLHRHSWPPTAIAV